MIPFAPPRIDQQIIDEVVDTLKSGWITTGPKTKKFEKKLAAYCKCQHVLCLNSATAGLEIMLRWFGVKEGDEVILPAYTYSATANVVVHCGATPVFVDVHENDFNINVNQICNAITPKTKVIMPVDFGGYPCDYNSIMGIVNDSVIKSIFSASNDIQKKLGRILVLSDSAHSLGARYKGTITGTLADSSVFSFHAVKNLTTAEGGAIALTLPNPFDNASVYDSLCISTLHGQNKDALSKLQKGNWRYDIVEAGYKMNMPDILASIGLVELERYDNETLPKRKQICETYASLLRNEEWAIVPRFKSDDTESSYHLFPLRIKNVTEDMRDNIMKRIFDNDVSVNVHFIPVPMMSFYRNKGYDIKNYPVTYELYSTEISLPVFFDLTTGQINEVIDVVKNAVKEELELHQI
jgi:dTDP-4-amino-4,6-dideoxygalactose transaminase